MSKLNELQRLQADRATLADQIAHLRAARLWEEVREAEADLLILDDKTRTATPLALAEVQARRAEEQQCRDAAAARSAKAEAERKHRVRHQLDRLGDAAGRLDAALATIAAPYGDVAEALRALEADRALAGVSAQGHGYNRAGAILAAIRAAIPEMAADVAVASRSIGPSVPLTGATMSAIVASIAGSASTSSPPPKAERSRAEIDEEIERALRDPAIARQIALARASEAA